MLSVIACTVSAVDRFYSAVRMMIIITIIEARDQFVVLTIKGGSGEGVTEGNKYKLQFHINSCAMQCRYEESEEEIEKAFLFKGHPCLGHNGKSWSGDRSLVIARVESLNDIFYCGWLPRP